MMNLGQPLGWITSSIFAGMSTLAFILVLTSFARWLNLIDKPDHRKLHGAPVPMIGGIAIYLGILSAMLVSSLPPILAWLMVAVTPVLVVGALDDAFGLGVKIRVVIQVVATVLMIAGGDFWIQSLGFGYWSLDPLAVWLGISFTVFSVVGLTNGFNMVDGMDGLASGHALIALATVGFSLFGIYGAVYQLEWLVVPFSAVFAFWLVNLSLTPLNRVFLGDAGALLLGFMVAWTLIYYTQKPVALLHPVVALWCVTFPVFDTLVVIARRLKNRQSPFSPDRNHLHHLLVDTGVKSRVSLAIILGLSAATNTLGVWLTYAVSPLVSIAVYGVLLLVFGCGMFHPTIEKKLTRKSGLIQ